MKTKRFVASPKLLIFFSVIVCLSLGSLVFFLVETFDKPINDVVMTVFLTLLLVSLAVALFVIGFTIGAFDVVHLREEETLIVRFGKKIRAYQLSQNTQIYVQKNQKGSQYIEIQFPEYFESAPRGPKGAMVRDGCVRISYSSKRLVIVQDVVLSYKKNNAPTEIPPEWSS